MYMYRFCLHMYTQTLPKMHQHYFINHICNLPLYMHHIRAFPCLLLKDIGMTKLHTCSTHKKGLLKLTPMPITITATQHFSPPTMAFVSREVLSINNQIVVCIQLPELAVDDVKVFVGEEIGDLVDVWLVLQQS